MTAAAEGLCDEIYTVAPMLCVHCSYRPVRVTKHRPARYCSDKCRRAHELNKEAAERRRLLNEIRSALGLPEGAGFTGNGELRRILAIVVERLETVDRGGHRGRRKVWGRHGTQKRYKQGCRCARCRGAEAAYRRDLRARRKVDHMHRCPPFIHCQSDPSPLATPQADRQPWDNPIPESQVA